MRLFVSLFLVAASCGSSSNDEQKLPDGSQIQCAAPETPTPSTTSSSGLLRVTEAQDFVNLGDGSFIQEDFGRLEAMFPEGNVWRFLGTIPQWAVETTTQAGCTLHRYAPPFCTEACEGEELCVAADTCAPFPASLSVGRLSIGGAQEVLSDTANGGAFGRGYGVTGASPLFDTGDPIVACAEGGELPAFQMTLPAPAPLGIEVPGEGIDFDPGTAYAFEWTPAGDDSRVRVELVNSNRGHGLPAELVIVCEADDAAGRIDVAAELVDLLESIEGSIPPGDACAGNDCLRSRLTRLNSRELVAGEMSVTYEVGRERLFKPY